MAGGPQPGANSRGRGGKFRKFTRGGGKHFSRDLRPLDAEGNEVSMWSEGAKKKKAEGSDSDDDSEEESSEEEESEEEEDPTRSAAAAAAAEASREDRRKEKKARKEAAIARSKGRAVQVGDMPSEDEEEEEEVAALPANPNHSKASHKQTIARAADDVTDSMKELSVGGSSAPQSRRERESLEAAQAKERYRKLHEQGKTDEAKADLARLKLIREKRAADAAWKQAEKEAKESEEKARREAEAKKREQAAGGKGKGRK